jgi:type IV pilus assembly protein PilQ
MKNNYRSAERKNRLMNSSLYRLGTFFVAMSLAPSVLAAKLQGLDVASLPGDKVELRSRLIFLVFLMAWALKIASLA